MSAAALLDRLPRLKKGRRPGDYWAGCSAHGSREGRPVHVTVLDDGTVLLHPFCGCQVGDVLAALGLRLSDLFPRRPPQHSYPATHSRIPARDLLEVISAEVSVVAIIAADLLAKKFISEPDWQRLAQAASRIGQARDHVG